jgi:hypothetical protein
LETIFPLPLKVESRLPGFCCACAETAATAQTIDNIAAKKFIAEKCILRLSSKKQLNIFVSTP